MRIAIIICFLIIIILLFRFLNFYGYGTYKNVGYRKGVCNYTLASRQVPVNKSYCPYRAILGTWTVSRDFPDFVKSGKLEIKLANPYTFLINGEPSGDISCSIGPQLTIRTGNRVFVLDGDKLLYNGEVYEILQKK